jgi:Ca2+-binding RTX toxin-like protein
VTFNRNRFRPELTQLEGRVVPSAMARISVKLDAHGVLTVNGTSTGDVIDIFEGLSTGGSSTYYVRDHGKIVGGEFPAARVKKIAVEGYGGNDLLSINLGSRPTMVNGHEYKAPALAMDINMGTGADSLYIGLLAPNLRRDHEAEFLRKVSHPVVVANGTLKFTERIFGAVTTLAFDDDLYTIRGAAAVQTMIDLSQALFPKGLNHFKMPEILTSGLNSLGIIGTAKADNISFDATTAGKLLTTINGFSWQSTILHGVNLIAYGGGGNDSIKLLGRGANLWQALFYGQAGNDVLVGGKKNDALNGGTGSNVLDGKGGTDTANKGGGTDRVVNCENGTAVPKKLVWRLQKVTIDEGHKSHIINGVEQMSIVKDHAYLEVFGNGVNPGYRVDFSFGGLPSTIQPGQTVTVDQATILSGSNLHYMWENSNFGDHCRLVVHHEAPDGRHSVPTTITPAWTYLNAAHPSAHVTESFVAPTSGTSFIVYECDGGLVGAVTTYYYVRG